MGNSGSYFKNEKLAKRKGYNVLADIEINMVGRSERNWSVWEKKKGSSKFQVGKWNEIISDVRRLGKQGYKLVDIEPYYTRYNKGWSYLAVFHKSKVITRIYKLNNWRQVVAKTTQLAKKGYCLTDIEIEGSGKHRRYIGIWGKIRHANYIWEASSWKAFVKKWEEYGKKNFRLIDIETFVSNGRRYYTGTWVSGKDGYYLWNVKGYSNFSKKFQELKRKGFRLVDLEVVY